MPQAPDVCSAALYPPTDRRRRIAGTPLMQTRPRRGRFRRKGGVSSSRHSLSLRAEAVAQSREVVTVE
jgi:hypothetical protein